ncbi:MAG: sugar ABC transporter substrate-binding protein [Clostridiaceae bacterium]|nr:sugar ABC transporter substrate-binding protein [Clostridiaceae bacterium]
MKKKLLALALVSTMTLCSACSGGGSKPAESQAPAATTAAASKTETPAATEAATTAAENTEPVTIKFANYALLEAGYEDFWNGVKEGFEKENPNITIEWVTAPYGEIVNQVINMAGGGDKVDLIFGEIGWVPGLEDAGLSVAVDEVLPADYLADFYPSVMESFNIDGKPYGLPMYVSPYVLYYNTELFEKAGLDPAAPPTTYDEMMEYAEKLSQLKDDNGNPVYAFGQTTASVPVSGSAINGMIFNFGGTLLDEEGNLSIDNQGFKDAITMLKTLDEKGYNPQNAKLKDLRNLFALGQLAMYYDQSWGYNGIQSINPDAKNFTASAKPLKGGAGDGQSILQAHCLIFADNGDAKKEAAGKLAQYIITPEVLNDYLANITPAYPAKAAMADSVADNDVLKGAAGSAENVIAQVFVPRISDLNLELCTLAQAVTVSGKDVDTAIEEFRKAAEAILAE